MDKIFHLKIDASKVKTPEDRQKLFDLVNQTQQAANACEKLVVMLQFWP